MPRWKLIFMDGVNYVHVVVSATTIYKAIIYGQRYADEMKYEFVDCFRL